MNPPSDPPSDPPEDPPEESSPHTDPPSPPTPSHQELASRLRLMVITHPRPACGRALEDVVAECCDAGATAIELRDKDATAEDLLRQAEALVRVAHARNALLIVNDRLDVALAAGADGVHLGPDDLPVEAARRVAPHRVVPHRTAAPRGFLIGYSTDDPDEALAAAGDGADYLGVGAVYGTRSKPGLEDEAIGPARVRQVLEAAGLPGVGIGGITAENAGAVVQAGAGVAVLGAVMGAPDPGRAVRAILKMGSTNRRA